MDSSIEESKLLKIVNHADEVDSELVAIDNVALKATDVASRVRPVVSAIIMKPNVGFLMKMPKAAIRDGKFTKSPLQRPIRRDERLDKTFVDLLREESGYQVKKGTWRYLGSAKVPVPPRSQSYKAELYDFQLLHFVGHIIPNGVTLPVGEELHWLHINDVQTFALEFVSERKRAAVHAVLVEFASVFNLSWEVQRNLSRVA